MAKTKWYQGLFNKDWNSLDLDVCIGDLETKIYYKELILQSIINLMANTVSRIDFETYNKDEQVKSKDYYAFNIQANQNQSATMFWKKVVYQMVMNNEALVIMQNDEFYLAESFTRTTGAFVENIYSDIVIENYTIKESKKESEVFYFTLNNADIERVVSNFYSDYSKLIELNIKAFKSNNTKKGTLEIPTSYPQTELAQGKLKELINERFKEYLNSETNAVLPLTNGLKFVEAGGSSYKTTNTTNRETRELINDLIDLFGMAFNVPPNLLKGTITDASGDINLFITFCINPLAETFSSEINRKYFTREEYLNGDYVRLDTNNIKVTDLKDIAGSLDILTRIGAFNINDSLRKLGMKTLNDDFAKVHFITKNYEPVQHMIDNPEGNKEGNIQTNIAEGGE